MAGSSSNEVGLGSRNNAQSGEGVDLLQPLQPASSLLLTQAQLATQLLSTRQSVAALWSSQTAKSIRAQHSTQSSSL